MVDSSYYAKIGLEAAKRAAKKVVEQAHKDNQPMPIWDGEKVIYAIPPIPPQKHNGSSEVYYRSNWLSLWIFKG